MPDAAPATSYDELPYVNKAFPQTHPDRLATIATLFGLQPPELATCRVLELGCASGDNLAPMALGLPNARFLGVDLSGRDADGRSALEIARDNGNAPLAELLSRNLPAAR